MGSALVKASGLGRQFFRKGRESARYFDAVADVDLSLEQGELVVLVGRSGSGKTTLTNMLAGLLQPTSGTVSVAGHDLYACDDKERSRLRNELIGVAPQGASALRSLTVVQNVALPSLMYREDDAAEQRALALLERLGIKELADSFPNELSGGELRRMSIARALACKPRLVLADEPTSDLDDENTRSVLEMLKLVAREGAAVLMVTHDQIAASYADRMLRMDAGRVHPEGAAGPSA